MPSRRSDLTMPKMDLWVFFMAVPALHFNAAPAWVFVLLGGVMGIIALYYYFAADVGGEKNCWSGDPCRQYYLNMPPKWQVLGFPMYEGYPPSESYGPFGGFSISEGNV